MRSQDLSYIQFVDLDNFKAELFFSRLVHILGHPVDLMGRILCHRDCQCNSRDTKLSNYNAIFNR